MGSQRSILMLGGSAQQVVAIRKARELGFRTVVCDYLPDNPGRHEADSFYPESTTNPEGVLEIAKREHVGGVIAYSSDPASPTAAYVADRLGLPTNPRTSIDTMSHKHKMRAHMSRRGLPCPRHVSFPGDADRVDVLRLVSGFRWPLVLKPTDSSGSKGVTVVRDEGKRYQLPPSARRPRTAWMLGPRPFEG